MLPAYCAFCAAFSQTCGVIPSVPLVKFREDLALPAFRGSFSGLRLGSLPDACCENRAPTPYVIIYPLGGTTGNAIVVRLTTPGWNH